MLIVDALEVGEIADHEPQQIVMLAGHEIALHHFRHPSYRALEGLESGLTLAVERDAHEDIDGEAGALLIDQRRIALDQT